MRRKPRLVEWNVVFTKQAKRDAKKLARSGRKAKAKSLLAILAEDPWRPPYEKLIGDLVGACSRKIDIQHRLVYQALEKEHTVKVIRMWTHYE